jgi:hypothetical protein
VLQRVSPIPAFAGMTNWRWGMTVCCRDMTGEVV